jgi:hypothetical protein
MIIFVFPLFLLGTVTPSLARYTMESLDDSGRVVGSLNACNTIGSIIGTFIPTFVTIPAAGTAATFLIFSGILLVLHDNQSSYHHSCILCNQKNLTAMCFPLGPHRSYQSTAISAIVYLSFTFCLQ